MKNLNLNKQSARRYCMALVLWMALGSHAQAFMCIGSDCGVSIRLEDRCVCKQDTCAASSSSEGFANPSPLILTGSVEVISAGCCSCADHEVSIASAVIRHAFSGLGPSISALPMASVLSLDDARHSFQTIRAYLSETTNLKDYSLIITSSTILLI